MQFPCFNKDCQHNDKSDSGCNVCSRFSVDLCESFFTFFADDLPKAYAYRIYNSDTDTIKYEITTNREEALKRDGFPVELKPTRELERDA